jgi:hypothetical protein
MNCESRYYQTEESIYFCSLPKGHRGKHTWCITWNDGDGH